MTGTVLRLMFGLLAFLAANLLSQIPAHVLGDLGVPAGEHPAWQGVEGLMYIGWGLLLVLLLQVRLERSPLVHLGLQAPRPTAGRDLARGLLLGAGGFALVIGLQWTVGAITPAGFLWQVSGPLPLLGLAAGLIWMAAVAWNEELFLRGYLLQMLRRRHGIVAAVTVTSLSFSLLHLLVGNPSILALVNTALAGVFFCLLVIAHGHLWTAVGFHFAWNAMQAYGLQLLSRPDQSLQAVAGLRPIEGVSPIWWGGPYGSEGSLPATAVISVLILVYAWRLRRFGLPLRF